jgi:hypothetical protein
MLARCVEDNMPAKVPGHEIDQATRESRRGIDSEPPPNGATEPPACMSSEKIRGPADVRGCWSHCEVRNGEA